VSSSTQWSCYLQIVKPTVDTIAALLLIVLTSPALIVIGILIILDSPGGIIFKQTRMGLHCKEFVMFKFRTMKNNSPEMNSFSTAPGDLRISRIGRILRHWSLDELPQLFNILFQQMSFIGPRPDVLEQRNDYTAEELRRRHLVRPGLSGLAQVCGRNQLRASSRKRYDIFYAEHASLKLDLFILCKSVPTVLKGSF